MQKVTLFYTDRRRTFFVTFKHFFINFRTFITFFLPAFLRMILVTLSLVLADYWSYGSHE